MGGTICVTSRKADQVSRSTLWLPWFIVNQIISSVQMAEAKVQRAPSIFEIFVEMKANYPKLPVNTIFEGAAVLSSLYREDWLYMNDIATHYSLNKHTGFSNYSERFREKFGAGYGCARDGTVVVKTARTINHANLIQMLKSKDE